jgi:predicted amino acid dehydrogenase
MPRDLIRDKILNASIYAQEELNIELIQLGAFTTSVTSGGKWLEEQDGYKGFINHGDSYTAAVTCQAALKSINALNKDIAKQTLAVVGSYGVIGEAVTKLLVPEFSHSILIGRRKEKLLDLQTKIDGNYEISTVLNTKDADVIITATSHPEALLNSSHIKNNAIVVDVSQPPNLSIDSCKKRPDIIRVDGGYVDLPFSNKIRIPGIPQGKIFSCVAEVIMQAMENERKNHVGSIEISHLKKTEEWALKYGFVLKDLTNFGKKINFSPF